MTAAPLSLRCAVAAALLALAGCAQQGPAARGEPAPAPGQPPMAAPMPPAATNGCNAAAARGLVGRAYSDTLAEQARQAAGAQSVRMARAGQAAAREPVPQRLTLELDSVGNVVRASCG